MSNATIKKDGNGFPAYIYNPLNITAAAPTTTLVKTGEGFLHTLVINTPVATGVITIYDSLTATGTKIGTITMPAGPTAPVSVLYDVQFSIGLTIVTATAAQDLTVSYI